jgi:hypothetical protein
MSIAVITLLGFSACMLSCSLLVLLVQVLPLVLALLLLCSC